MQTNPRPVKMITSSVGCDVDETTVANSVKTDSTTTDIIRDNVQRYMTHASEATGLKPKFSSNFRIDQVEHLLAIPKAAFLRVYLSLDSEQASFPTLIMSVTDIKGNVLQEVGANGDIPLIAECCGYPPGDGKFANDPFLLT